jgi:hypothetical protein
MEEDPEILLSDDDSPEAFIPLSDTPPRKCLSTSTPLLPLKPAGVLSALLYVSTSQWSSKLLRS